MSDPAVQKWRQRGRIFLWRYHEGRTNYPGWHLTADEVGSQSLLDLLELFQAARWSCQMLVRTTVPDASVLRVPNNRGGAARVDAATTLSLKFPKGKVDDEHWLLDQESQDVQLVLGAQKLRDLTCGVQAFRRGEDDFAISGSQIKNDDCLWFWWYGKK